MVSIKTPIVLAGIGLSLIIIFLSISRFGLPLFNEIGKSAGDTLGNLSTGITDFFSSFDTQTQEDIQRTDAEEVFEKQLEQKEQESIDAGFDSVEEYERATDENSIFNTALDDLTKFNPPDTIGFGIESLNEGRGIEDTEENRLALFDIIQGAGESGITSVNDIDFSSFASPVDKSSSFVDVAQDFFNSLIPSVPQASAVEQTTQTISQVIDTPQGSTSIQGIVVNQLDTDQEFEVFSSDSSQSVTGVIRETEQDPSELQTDSQGNPTETASERANRVFEETGEFADEDSGATPASEIAEDFDFGTNTGSGGKIDTDVNSASSEDLTLEERLKIEAEKASTVFDSRSISNW